MRILVLDGGGQLGTFQWGVMNALKDAGLNFEYFDEYYATSAGAFNAAFFLAEQFAEGKRMWLKHLPEGFWKPFYNDMQFLENTLTAVEQLNCELIASRKQKIYVTLANRRTLAADYLCLDQSQDIINLLLAGCSMPILSFPRKIGQNFYYDGGLVAQPPIEKATQNNPHAEIWVITTKPAGYRLNTFYWKILSFLEIFNVPAWRLLWRFPARQNAIMDMLDANNPGFKIIRPEKTLPIGFRSTDKTLIQQTYDIGYSTGNNYVKSL